MAPDSLASTVCDLEFREAHTKAEGEVEVCLEKGTGIDEARLVVGVNLAWSGVNVEGVFSGHSGQKGTHTQNVKIIKKHNRRTQSINETIRKLNKTNKYNGQQKLVVVKE